MSRNPGRGVRICDGENTMMEKLALSAVTFGAIVSSVGIFMGFTNIAGLGLGIILCGIILLAIEFLVFEWMNKT